jgi:trimethylamine--corrinoid protein Co-methyltransferase
MIYASAPSCGTTGPCSITGTVVVSNAEVLSGLVIHQLAEPGAPFVYGCGCDAMDMRTMLPAYCVPESLLGLQAMTDLARHYDLPSFSYAGMSDAKLLDGQLAAEVALTIYTGGLSRATLLHDIGYMETGLRSSYEGLVLADELVRHVRSFMRELRVDAEALALDEIDAVGPGGNYLAQPATRRLCRTFWQPELFDHVVYDRWAAAGERDLTTQLSEKVKALLHEPREYALDESSAARVEAILARGRGSGS